MQRDPNSLQTGKINRAVADNARGREAVALFDLRGQRQQRAGDRAVANLFVGENTNEKRSRNLCHQIESQGLISPDFLI